MDLYHKVKSSHSNVYCCTSLYFLVLETLTHAWQLVFSDGQPDMLTEMQKSVVHFCVCFWRKKVGPVIINCMTRSLLDSAIEMEFLVSDESSYFSHYPVKYDMQRMLILKVTTTSENVVKVQQLL